MKNATVCRARALFLLLAAPLALASAAPAPADAPPKSAPKTLFYTLPADNYGYLDSAIVLIGAEVLNRRYLGVLPPGDPKPSADPQDLDGAWLNDQSLVYGILRDMYGFKLPYTAAARRMLNARFKENYVNGTPFVNASGECRPPGQLWQYTLNFPFQIYQGKRTIVFIFQEYHGRWVIRMDQPHRPASQRFYMGDSVGHWDGDTLVVDTTNFKIPQWLDVDGTPVSRNAHLVFRIRKIEEDGPELEIVMTVHDPAMYAHPWSIVNDFEWRPDKVIFSEYNCEMQVGAPGGIARYGLIPEPPGE